MLPNVSLKSLLLIKAKHVPWGTYLEEYPNSHCTLKNSRSLCAPCHFWFMPHQNSLTSNGVCLPHKIIDEEPPRENVHSFIYLTWMAHVCHITFEMLQMPSWADKAGPAPVVFYWAFLSIMFSVFMQVSVLHSFWWLKKIPLYGYTTICWSIH